MGPVMRGYRGGERMRQERRGEEKEQVRRGMLSLTVWTGVACNTNQGLAWSGEADRDNDILSQTRFTPVEKTTNPIRKQPEELNHSINHFT